MKTRESGSLTLYQVGNTPSFEGTYTCTASSRAGSDSTDAELVVDGKFGFCLFDTQLSHTLLAASKIWRCLSSVPPLILSPQHTTSYFHWLCSNELRLASLVPLPMSLSP